MTQLRVTVGLGPLPSQAVGPSNLGGNLETDPSHWASALRESHARLRAVVEPLSDGDLESQSYDTEWSVAQVLSHIGSGATIFGWFVDAALSGGDAPGRERFEPVWAEWNAKSPREVADDALAVDGALVERMSSLDERDRERLHLSLFGMELDAAGLMRIRLGEHALHTWDIAVTFDDRARVLPAAVTLLVDTLDLFATRTGKPSAIAQRIGISTSEPDRSFVLYSGEPVSLAPGDVGAGSPELVLPAEALIRLVYGRLDEAHCDDVAARGVDLDTVRAVFPGP